MRKATMGAVGAALFAVGLWTTAGGRAQAPAPQATNNPKVETVATLPDATPTENITETKDGNFYVTGIDDCVLYKISPKGAVDKFYADPNQKAFVGVATNDNGFVLITFSKPFRHPNPSGQGQVIDFSDVGPAIQVLDKTGKLVATIPGEMGEAFNGIALAGKDWYLAADSNAASVWRVDPGKKKLELWIKNDVFAPVKPPVQGGANMGANGIKVFKGYAYVGSRGALYKVKIGDDGKAEGDPVMFAQVRYDDFAFAPDGSIYGPAGNTIMKVSPTGEVSKFMESVPPGPAAWVTKDGKWLYWPTRGGTAPQRLVRVPLS